MAGQRVDVNQAAALLGISTDAVRKRARRGTLDSEKGADGYLYIWLDGGAPSGSTPTQAHLDSLEEQIEFLRGELERKDHLLAAALERIPAIEAPESAGEASDTTAPVHHRRAAGANLAPLVVAQDLWRLGSKEE